jgi:hypothetical protein
MADKDHAQDKLPGTPFEPVPPSPDSPTPAGSGTHRKDDGKSGGDQE